MSNSKNKARIKSYYSVQSASTQLGKIQPKAVDVEEVILGALMLEKDAIHSVHDKLKPERFYDQRHRYIYESIVALSSKSDPINLMTVTSELRGKGLLEKAGGAHHVASLTTRVNSAANIEHHAQIIIEHAIRREMIRISAQIQEGCFENTGDAFELLKKAEQSLFEISELQIKRKYQGMHTLMVQAFEELETRKNKKAGLTGVPSGFSALDRITSGWQPSDLVIIAARPGMGKTAFVVSAMRNAAVDFGQAVAIFSLEMPAIQLVSRLISAESKLEGSKIKKGNLEDHEFEQLVFQTKKLAEAPIFIDDTPGLSILELRAKCRRLHAQEDIKLIIIDYLQLMSGDSAKSGKGGNREQEIASISRALKGIAKELNVPVIALAQLSRSVETRGGEKRPMLSDLRESGSIEQDADIVMFLYRPEYYDIVTDDHGNSTVGTGDVIIAKHRNGPLDTITLKFEGKYTKFCDLDIYDEQMNISSGPSDEVRSEIRSMKCDL